jgi:uncharacterized protein GlcG (DUF336 family)
MMRTYVHRFALAGLLAIPTLLSGQGQGNACRELPSHATLRAALQTVVIQPGHPNGGLDQNMWATIVNRDGQVCAVVFSGNDRGDQWPGSRVISAQKANTANAFSLPTGTFGIFSGLSLSTANLYSAVQPGGSLYGLQHSNPVDTRVAYDGNSENIGRPNDPMVGEKIGGVNVFGGGLALYTASGQLLGGLGVSGDTSCTDHVVAWKVRHLLNLDNVPSGVAPGSSDNMIQDISNVGGQLVSASGFGHPTCLNNPSPALLQTACPKGPASPLAGCARAVVTP